MELRADLGQRHVAHFVEGDQVVPQPARQRPSDGILLPSSQKSSSCYLSRALGRSPDRAISGQA